MIFPTDLICLDKLHFFNKVTGISIFGPHYIYFIQALRTRWFQKLGNTQSSLLQLALSMQWLGDVTWVKADSSLPLSGNDQLDGDQHMLSDHSVSASMNDECTQQSHNALANMAATGSHSLRPNTPSAWTAITILGAHSSVVIRWFLPLTLLLLIYFYQVAIDTFLSSI